MFLKGKNLIKIHNCFFCHNIFKFLKINNFYPKLKNQYKDYLLWSFNQYKNMTFRNNFLMNSQINSLSIFDIKNILFFINKI
ncbi:c-type cytochrome [Candidatus Nasuia deltocephalinicola]|uniref:c-type cytochrome n=1 Tax=Candidatus Nasuia deltocephalincola TaxID=1160784 RepID=UPI00216AF772|nr:hypothetical protein [Candidatus Nasuia deltocephalinicola]